MNLFKALAHEYIHMASDPSPTPLFGGSHRHVPHRAASVPELNAVKPKQKRQAVYSGIGYTTPRVLPLKAGLEKAAEFLSSGKRVATLFRAGEMIGPAACAWLRSNVAL